MHQVATVAEVSAEGAARPGALERPRLQSVDLLRGAVMVVMALDHVRDFVSVTGFNPTDLSRVTPALFLTRWVTHFCAPTFVFLAGCGAYLGRTGGKSRPELSRFLVSRGLWLVFLELTVVRFTWSFDFSDNWVGVIWVIGWSMVALAALIWLPTWVVGAFGVMMIAGHDAFDGVHGGALWTVLHDQRPAHLLLWDIFVAYPLIPWVGVMAAGYALGPVLRMAPERRRRALVALGLASIALFVGLRALNVYGDPSPWAHQRNGFYTLLSFINVSKYPPSLLFLLVTLGPALLALAALDRVRAGAANPLLVFGRVPFFYYLAHLFLIHLVAVAILLPEHGLKAFTVSPDVHPPGSGLSLPWVYAVWVAVVAALYWPCRWYAGVKARTKNPLLSYL
ncbi:MAG TPA: heparan-alpha-glucosaminide N-acetyltransferase domain-containing protein [Myxococcaceae bacterium]|nr:heparan-alpha-glucosaminide N-acetyltransferase domain-containing protein [Myxococcaceae bacterium]